MKMYFVLSKHMEPEDKEYSFKVMTGMELATVFGMQDCSGVIVFKVWEIDSVYGTLRRRFLEEALKPPFNRMFVYDERYEEIMDVYETPEH